MAGLDWLLPLDASCTKVSFELFAGLFKLRYLGIAALDALRSMTNDVAEPRVAAFLKGGFSRAGAAKGPQFARGAGQPCLLWAANGLLTVPPANSRWRDGLSGSTAQKGDFAKFSEQP